jgi:hypothetical protein
LLVHHALVVGQSINSFFYTDVSTIINLRVFSRLLTLTWRGKAALTGARRLWCTLTTDESTFEELEMLGGPVQWLDVKTIMAMLPEKVI